MSCITGIVGVTANTELPFYADLDAGLKTSIAASTSGLYIDEIPTGIDMMGVDDVEYLTSLLKMGLKAERVAEKSLIDELVLAINSRYIEAKPRFNGDIGRKMTSQTLLSNGNNQGQQWQMKHAYAGSITITRAALNITGSVSCNIYIAACNVGERYAEVIHTIPVTTVAGNWSNGNLASFGNQIVLPMQVEGVAREYLLFWKRDEAGGAYPKNNDLKCDTCPGATTNKALAGFMTFRGASFTSIENMVNMGNDSYAHGLSITALVQCDSNEVICREFDKNNAVKLMIQKAVQYKAAEMFAEYVMESSYVNRTNLQAREFLWGKRSHNAAEFSKRITAIADTMKLGDTPCYTCQDQRVVIGKILK